MEDTLIFVDDGFFGLVKKKFKKETGNNNKYAHPFINGRQFPPPYQSPKPTKNEIFMINRYTNMVKMLKKKKWITLREGRCQRTLNKDKKFDYRQKGVDALIILDMCDFKEDFPDIKKIILIASDSDFVPVIERMKKKGNEIILYTYFDRKRNSRFSTSNHLLKVSSKWVKLEAKDFEDS